MPIANREAIEPAWENALIGLADSVPALVEDFLTELSERGLYERGSVSPEDLEHTAHETFRLMIDRLCDRPMAAHQHEAPVRLAQRRARQGVSMELLSSAVRLDFLVLWRRLRDLLGQHHTDILVRNTELVLTVVEEYIGQVQSEFLAESARLARDARLATERHLGRLLNTDVAGDGALDQIAAGLRVAADSSFEIAISTPDAVQRLQDIVDSDLSSGRLLGYAYRNTFCVIKESDDDPGALLERVRQVPGAYAQGIGGLASVRDSVEGMSALIKAHREIPRMMDVSRLWGAAAAELLATMLPGFPDQYLSRLEDVPEAEFRLTVEAVARFLGTGSIKGTAAELGCHRNTVINRLKFFQTETGLDVRVPVQAAVATLVLEYADMHMHKLTAELSAMRH